MSEFWFHKLPWLSAARAETATNPLTVADIHTQHGAFVFASLQRLGVRGPGLPDAHQEVFLVVHRRLSTYEPNTSVTAWLHAICRRVAAAHRRKAHRRREVPIEFECDIGDLSADPSEDFERYQQRQLVERLLDTLDLDRRTVLVMYEIEGMQCEQIALLLGIPVGTVYSRLHLARRDFNAAVARFEARERGLRGGVS